MGVNVGKNFMKKKCVGLWMAKSDCIPVLIFKIENMTYLKNFIPRQYLFLNMFHAPRFILVFIHSSNKIFFVSTYTRVLSFQKFVKFKYYSFSRIRAY